MPATAWVAKFSSSPPNYSCDRGKGGGEGKTDREGQFSPGSTASFVRSNWPRDKDASKLKNPSVKRVDSSGWVALAMSLACDRRSRDHTTA